MSESDAPLVLARWLHFGSLMIVFGASLFAFYAIPARLKAAPGLGAPTDRVVRSCAYLSLASGIVWMATSIALMADDPAALLDTQTLRDFFLETSFGPVWILRLCLLAALAGLASVLPRGRSAATRRGLVTFVAACALASQAWLGHAAMANGGERGLELASYNVHVLAAGAWVGALVPLGLLSAGGRSAGSDTEPGDLCTILRRFSAVGMILVHAILFTGIANGFFRLSAARDLAVSDYGRAILAKLFLFAIMLSIAAFNRWRLMASIAAKPSQAIRALHRNIVLEQALAALVLLAAAILGMLPPGP